MLGAVFIEDGIGAVDVDEDFAAESFFWILIQQTAGPGDGKVSDLASGFFAATGLDEFVVTPKSAINQNEVAGFHPGFPFAIVAGE